MREANKVIRSNQKLGSLTPELAAEAINTHINICGLVMNLFVGTVEQ